MEIFTFVSEGFQENTYIIKDNNGIVLIDPGTEIELIKSGILKNKQKIKYILLTHGHYDHILAALQFNVPIYAHEDERIIIEDPEANLSVYIFNKKLILRDVKYFSGRKYQIDDFEIFHTPGHTGGSVIIKKGKNLFTGDTLFLDTVGRTDLPTGNSEILQQSLKIFDDFDRNIMCYPGHGEPFILSDAYKYNYFLQRK